MFPDDLVIERVNESKPWFEKVASILMKFLLWKNLRHI